MTNKEQIMIDTNKYFVEIIDESRSTIGYNVVRPERLLMDIIKQNKQLTRKTQECEELKEELKILKNNEDLLISKLQVLWGKQIAEEQGDCKNIDYSKPRTREIYHKITEIDRTLKDVAIAQSIMLGKTQSLGDTGSPKSYKRWEARERKLLEREFLK